MAYSPGMVQTLTDWIGTLVPPGGALLELGEQQINPDVPLEVVRELVLKGSGDDAELHRYFVDGKRRVADAFRGERFTYLCVDLTAGEMVMTADLNTVVVPDHLCGRFDLVTNLGTTEHVADQINVFRAVHDFTKLGGTMFHAVPFAGYYNHGLINYHPAFFILLADANGYEIDRLDLSAPHLPFTIPVVDAMPGSAAWRSVHQQSGMLHVRLRKVRTEPFALFTDYDVTALGRRQLRDPWDLIMAERYDLRVR